MCTKIIVYIIMAVAPTLPLLALRRGPLPALPRRARDRTAAPARPGPTDGNAVLAACPAVDTRISRDERGTPRGINVLKQCVRLSRAGGPPSSEEFSATLSE